MRNLQCQRGTRETLKLEHRLTVEEEVAAAGVVVARHNQEEGKSVTDFFVHLGSRLFRFEQPHRALAPVSLLVSSSFSFSRASLL